MSEVIKNWEKVKDTPFQVMYRNTLPKFKPFHDNNYLSIKQIGLTSEWGIQFTKAGKGSFSEPFATREDAIEHAINYMRGHLNG